MEKTIRNDINSNNLSSSLFGTAYGFMITLAVGFIGTFVAIAATSNNESYKIAVLKFVGFFIIGFLILISINFFHSLFTQNRYNRILTIIRILKDIKKSEL